jgi:hypothetical protein
MLGQQPPCGTGDSKILIDEEYMIELLKDVKDTNHTLTIINEADESGEYGDRDGEVREDYSEDDFEIEFNLNKGIEGIASKCYKLPEQKIKYI